MSKCSDCQHYELFKMITGRQAFGYSGDIPCLRCERNNNNKTDEFVTK
jgi:hypothetical protein